MLLSKYAYHGIRRSRRRRCRRYVRAQLCCLSPSQPYRVHYFSCARLAEHMNEHGANILGYVLLLVFAALSLSLYVLLMPSSQVVRPHTHRLHSLVSIHSFVQLLSYFCLYVCSVTSEDGMLS